MHKVMGSNIRMDAEWPDKTDVPGKTEWPDQTDAAEDHEPLDGLEGASDPEDSEDPEARIVRIRRRRRNAKRKRKQELKQRALVLAAAAVFLALLAVSGIARRIRSAVQAEREHKEELRKEKELEEREEELLSDSVLQYRDLVEYYAEEEGISEYVPVLLAIMEVETKGERDDVMQSSESAGLEPDSLGPEDSIAQACDYFRGLVDRASEIDVDDRSIIQAYNYGPGYLYYVAEHGGRHSFELAVDYAEEMSGGRTANYTHYIADDNGNWMYLYGNMYYVKLVEQYLP